MPDHTIGQRIRTERLRHGKSLAVIAGQAGISVGHLSKMERGLERCDRRSTLTRIANALGVELGVLTGSPVHVTDPEQLGAQTRIPALRVALLGTDLDTADMAVPIRPLSELRAMTTQVADLRQACDYVAVGARLPGLLIDLHAAVHGSDRDGVLRLVTQACQSAALHAKDTGHADLSWIAAERGLAAARRLGDSLVIADAHFARAHALFAAGAFARGGRVAEAAADAAPTDSGDGLQVYGMHCLSVAFGAVGDRRLDDAAEPIAEATRVAQRTGQGNAFWHSFGPANVEMWRVSLAVEAGDGGRAVEIADRFDAKAMPTTSRRAAHLIDVGRAHAQIRGHEHQSLAALRKAEDLAPQRTRANPYVRDTVAVLLRRTRAAAGGLELRRMATRLGVS
ncbi:MAG TPA: helix-turn-helix domain-containing protein [Mycobacteriales bacterium]|nr:helix-turn-helix domain-containing protein [Mycobacteriales bacterium]